MSEAAALIALAAILAAAVARPAWAPDWVVAIGASLLLFAGGVLSAHEVRHTLASLGPTVGFLAGLLVLAAECGRAGLFDALGEKMALGARGRPRRLLALVFVAAAATTAVLSLDATVVLLTPVVFATAARARTSPRPDVYACSHLANSASLLLPVSNLTYTGSLATLLWRRVMRSHDEAIDLGQFTRLGLLTVPPVLVASTVALWLALRVT